MIVCRGSERSVLSDPLRDPKALGPSFLSDAGHPRGQAPYARYGSENGYGGDQRRCGGRRADTSTLEYLEAAGLSERYIVFFLQAFLRWHNPEPRVDHQRPRPPLYPQDARQGPHGRTCSGDGRDTRASSPPVYPKVRYNSNSPVEALLRDGERVVRCQERGLKSTRPTRGRGHRSAGGRSTHRRGGA